MWGSFTMAEERIKVIFGHLGRTKQAAIVSFIFSVNKHKTSKLLGKESTICSLW